MFLCFIRNKVVELSDIALNHLIIHLQTDEGTEEETVDHTSLPPLTESSMDHVHTMMSEAMMESTPETSNTRK